MYKHVVIYFELLKCAVEYPRAKYNYHVSYILNVIFGRSEKSEDIQYKMHKTIGKRIR